MRKQQYYAKTQEASQKDVEVFQCCKIKWKIILKSICQWDLNATMVILMTCVILHKVNIEDERDQLLELIIAHTIP